MSNNQDNSITSLNNLDINAWIKLNKENPALFEQLSRELIEATIASSSENNKQRLQGLQFQINMHKKLSKNPMQTCIKISEMMWEKVGELCQNIETLQDTIIKHNAAKNMQQAINLPPTITQHQNNIIWLPVTEGV